MNHPKSRVRTQRTSQTLRLLAALAAAGAPLAVHAIDVVKASNNTALNLTGSWVGGALPGTGDVILINNTFAANNTAPIGASLSVAGVRVANNAGGRLQISATTGATLTLGGSGIDMSVANQDLNILSALAMGANQNWSIGTGRALQVNGSVTTGGNTVSISGAGALDLRPTSTQSWGSEVTIGNTEVRINGAGANVTFGGTNTFDAFNIFRGTANIGTIGNFGVASNAGDGGTNTTITLGGSSTDGLFRYTGTTASTNRTFTRDRRATGSGIEVVTANETLTISGNLAMTTGGTALGVQTNWSFFGDGNLTVNGVISNSTAPIPDVVGINKSGAGTLTLGGNNTFTGGITLSGGTLALGASERINNGVTLSIANATFNAGTFTETLGALTVGTSSLISLGVGSVLNFADSSSANWTGGALSITGDFISGTSVRFGTTSSGLTSGQLGQITVNGFSPTIDSLGYLVIPEPSTYAAIAGALGLAVAVRRRMKRS